MNDPTTQQQDTVLVFNATTGMMYDVPESLVPSLQDYEIKLKARPRKSCNKCFGRGYIGYDPVKRAYQLCIKCARKTVDFEHAMQRAKDAAEQLQALKMAEQMSSEVAPVL